MRRIRWSKKANGPRRWPSLNGRSRSWLPRHGPSGPRGFRSEGKWPEALAILERTEQVLASAAWTERPARLLELNKAVAVAQRLDRIYQGPRRSAQPRPLPSSPDGTDHSAPSPKDVYDEAF